MIKATIVKAMAMTEPDERHEWRVVDDRCIGCGASVSVAPELIVWNGDRVRFARQPSNAAEEMHDRKSREHARISSDSPDVRKPRDWMAPEAIFSTLRTVASLAPGTEIIFQYDLPTELVDEETKQVFTVMITATAARNEPALTFFEPAKLAEQVRKLGCSEVWDFGPQEADARYCASRTDGIRLRVAHFMGARV